MRSRLLSKTTLFLLILAAMLYVLPSQAYEIERVRIVEKNSTPGTFPTITDALNSITDNSISNQYLIKVGPGLYVDRIVMKPYVDIEGSGNLATVVWNEGGATVASAATVTACNYAEIRNLGISNYGNNAYAVGVFLNGVSNCWLRESRITVGGGINNFGVYFTNNTTSTMTDVKVDVTGGETAYGLIIQSSKPYITESMVRVMNASNFNIAVSHDGGSLSLKNLDLRAEGGNNAFALVSHNGNPVFDGLIMAATGSANSCAMQVDNGTPIINGSILKAVGTTSAYAMFCSGGSPALNGLTMIAEAVTDAYAMKCTGGSPVLKGVTMTAQGGNNAYGLKCTGEEVYPLLNELTMTAVATNNAYALDSDNASPVLQRGTMTARGGNDAYAIRCSGGSLTLDELNITAEANSNNAYVMDCNNVSPVIHGGTMKARGGVDAYAMKCIGGGTPELSGVTMTAVANGNNAYVMDCDNVSPVVKGCTMTAQGVGDVYALKCTGGSPELSGVTMKAEGGVNAYALKCNGGGSPKLDDLNITASGSTQAYAMFFDNVSTVLQGGTMAAYGGQHAYAMKCNGGAQALKGVTMRAEGASSAHAIANSGLALTQVRDGRLIARKSGEDDTLPHCTPTPTPTATPTPTPTPTPPPLSPDFSVVYNDLASTGIKVMLENCSLEGVLSIFNNVSANFDILSPLVLLSHSRLDGQVYNNVPSDYLNLCNACYNAEFYPIPTTCETGQ